MKIELNEGEDFDISCGKLEVGIECFEDAIMIHIKKDILHPLKIERFDSTFSYGWVYSLKRDKK